MLSGDEGVQAMPVHADPGGPGPAARRAAVATGRAGQAAIAGLSVAANGTASLRAVDLRLSFGPKAIPR